MTLTVNDTRRADCLPTGIDGLDQIAAGGLPTRSGTVISGTAGSGKTVLGVQFLVAGITRFGQHGVFVTFEETAEEITRNVRSFGWDLAALVASGQLAIIDGSPQPGEELVETGLYDLSGLLLRIEEAVRRTGAVRVALDALGGLFSQFTDSKLVRRQLRRLAAGLKALGVTTVVTIERTEEDAAAGRYGIEEFVADNVILLRNRLDNENRRRTIEILKVRGAPHQKGEYPFTIDAATGLTIIPLSATELSRRSSSVRVSTGVPELDRMCGGGVFRDSTVLVSGTTGTGKTMLVTAYLKAAVDAGEKAILFGAEENREQFVRNAALSGVDLAAAEQNGQLKIICRHPAGMGLEDHLLLMKREIEAFGPDRVAVDSLSAFERSFSPKSFSEFVLALTSRITYLQITGLFTNTTSMLSGIETPSEMRMPTIPDAIILLRYVELNGEIRRGLTVLKMRGAQHEKGIREYMIDETGIHIDRPFAGVQGILTGPPTYGLESWQPRITELVRPSQEGHS